MFEFTLYFTDDKLNDIPEAVTWLKECEERIRAELQECEDGVQEGLMEYLLKGDHHATA